MKGVLGLIERFTSSTLSICILASTVALVVALPSIVNGFVYDDVWIIQQNDVVHTLDLKALVTSSYWPPDRGGAMWRPGTLVSLAIEWAVGGGSPTIFHAVNIVLYGIVAFLVALLGTRMFSPAVGLVSGILFAVHPVHVEVTANLVGQAELLAAVGYLAAMLAMWERGIAESARSRVGLLGLALAGFAFALGAKEHALTVPGVLMLLWMLVGRKKQLEFTTIVRREWLSLVPFVLMVAVYLLLRNQVVGDATAAGGLASGLSRGSVVQRAMVMLPVSLEWLRLLFLPIHLSADYSPLELVPEPAFGVNHALAVVIWSALLGLLWLKRNETPLVAGVVLFFVTVSVVSNVVVPLEILLAERLLFLPSVGWAFAVSGAVNSGLVSLDRDRAHVPVGVVVAVVSVLFAARSIQRATVWHDNDGFFTHLLEDAPNSFRSHWALGWYAFERGDSVLGEREMRMAIRLNPDHPQLLEDLGRRYAASDLYEPAITLLTRAVDLDSGRISAALPLALALERSGHTDEASRVLDAMSRLHGETRGIALVRGEVLLAAKQFDSASSVLDELIAREPRAWVVRKMAAQAAAGAGACRTAIAQADTALTLAPEPERRAIELLRARVANSKSPCK
ncbi:MAG: hypothetical protein ACE5HT_05135 [Gemmatimonadales bacterium]